ncbi:sialate O-acetylesterase [Paenibacillus chartarius]|uniref:Sialate O-acetylesterase n=1 Tax=Paenibacillus chartarius TaxID=747481 RepID=A0ABV6DGX8_9BACL
MNSQHVDLIMFMGQSNMAGRGEASEAPKVQTGKAFEFRAVSDPTTLYPLTEPFGVYENNEASGVCETTKTGSMVSAFAAEYTHITNRTIIGVSCSKGGTSINLWQPNGAFLNDAISRYHTAKAWLTENGYTIQNQFMVWCQGETDGDHGMPGGAYAAKLQLMIDAMVAAGLERCYIVRIGCHRDHPTLYDEIMQAQTELCKTYPNAVLVSTKFASMAAEGHMKDPFHYTQYGYNTVGADAGINTAFHITHKKEPYMYDPKSKELYVSHK